MVIKHRKESICSAAEAANLFRAVLHTEDEASREREHFWAVGLTVKNVTVYLELVSLGSLSASVVHPRELFRLAVIKGVAAMIVGHNHPSGDPKPSQEDILLTRRICQAGQVLGIMVLDHVIIGEDDSHFSFRDEGLIKTPQ